MTKDRAWEIFNQRTPFGNLPNSMFSEAERQEVRELWDKLDGNFSFMDAFCHFLYPDDGQPVVNGGWHFGRALAVRNCLARKGKS